jgi:predicted DNA-binding ribbon-helix-helix protein
MPSSSSFAQSPILKRSIMIAGHKTSISLENEFWTALKKIAQERGMKLSDLLGAIDQQRQGNLSSAIRVFVIERYCGQATAAGDRAATESDDVSIVPDTIRAL